MRRESLSTTRRFWWMLREVEPSKDGNQGNLAEVWAGAPSRSTQLRLHPLLSVRQVVSEVASEAELAGSEAVWVADSVAEAGVDSEEGSKVAEGVSKEVEALVVLLGVASMARLVEASMVRLEAASAVTEEVSVAVTAAALVTVEALAEVIVEASEEASGELVLSEYISNEIAAVVATKVGPRMGLPAEESVTSATSKVEAVDLPPRLQASAHPLARTTIETRRDRAIRSRYIMHESTHCPKSLQL